MFELLDFRARVGEPVLFSHVYVMILTVMSDQVGT